MRSFETCFLTTTLVARWCRAEGPATRPVHYFSVFFGWGSVYAWQTKEGSAADRSFTEIANLGCFSIFLIADARCSCVHVPPSGGLTKETPIGSSLDRTKLA